MFWRSLSKDDVKFSYLRFWRQRELAAVNLSLSPLHENLSYQASENAIRVFCTTSSTWNNRKWLNLTQSSILMWRFRCSYRRSFLNSLQLNSSTVRTNCPSIMTLNNWKIIAESRSYIFRWRSRFRRRRVCLSSLLLKLRNECISRNLASNRKVTASSTYTGKRKFVRYIGEHVLRLVTCGRKTTVTSD